MTFSVCFAHRKPYTPDIFNDLGPYYNKYLIDYITRDQVKTLFIQCVLYLSECIFILPWISDRLLKILVGN